MGVGCKHNNARCELLCMYSLHPCTNHVRPSSASIYLGGGWRFPLCGVNSTCLHCSRPRDNATVRCPRAPPQMSDPSMYSVMRTAHGLTGLELRGVNFPSYLPRLHPLLVVAGMPLRHMVLHVARFQSDFRHGMEEAVTSVLAGLPHLVSLDMSFPPCAAFRAGASRRVRRSAQWRVCGGSQARLPVQAQAQAPSQPLSCADW